MHRLRVSKDGLRVTCPAAHRTILTESCSQGETEHCDYFNGLDFSRGAVYLLCEYGLEDRRSSIIVPSQYRTGE